MEHTEESAYQAGTMAMEDNNPYGQREGELWKYNRQDLLYEAWKRGWNSITRGSNWGYSR